MTETGAAVLRFAATRRVSVRIVLALVMLVVIPAMVLFVLACWLHSACRVAAGRCDWRHL